MYKYLHYWTVCLLISLLLLSLRWKLFYTGTALPPHQPSTMFAEMWVEESDGEGKEAAGLLSSEADSLPHSNFHPKPLAVS